MPDSIAAIVRFSGDPDDLFERFERARRLSAAYRRSRAYQLG